MAEVGLVPENTIIQGIGLVATAVFAVGGTLQLGSVTRNLDKKGGITISTSGPSNLRNQARYPNNYQPPYRPGTLTAEGKLSSSANMVRVHGANNMKGSWILPKDSIKGLSPQEIQSIYSLPEPPTHISDVKAAGQMVFVGVADSAQFAPDPTIHPGGAIQYELVDFRQAQFINSKPLQ